MIERNLRTKDFLWKLCEPRENGMIFFRVLKGKNLNVMPGGNTFQKGRQKTQGFVEKHMLKECLCSRPAVRLWRRDPTREPGLTQRSKGQGKG